MNPQRFLCARGSRSTVFCLGIWLSLSGAAAGVSGQEVLIGMNDVDQPGGPDELVAIDLPSGVASHVYFFSSGMNLLESLAYDSRESVLWTTNDGVLHRIGFGLSAMAFNVVQVGDTGKRDIDGLSVQPSTGLLFGITHGGNDLLLIDKSDAGTSVINSNVELGSRLEDLAFDPTGRLFVLTSNSLVELDPTDGSRLLRVRLSGASSLEGLVWWKEGGVFLSAADRGRFKDLVTIDLAGNVQYLSERNSGFRDLEALAFVSMDSQSEVPVTLLAAGIQRHPQGVQLRWRSQEAVTAFLVQRSRQEHGPWETIGTLPVASLPSASAEPFEFTDSEAVASLQDIELFYRVGAQDEEGNWTWLFFHLQAAPVPQQVRLLANAPNPFNPQTSFGIELAQPQTVTLQVFDIRGRLVHARSLRLGSGAHRLLWDGRDLQGHALSSGIYPYVLRAGSRQLRARAVLAR